MRQRMTPIEKLAREICWLGFTHPLAKEGKTKASYWKAITADARRGYVGDAQHFAYLLKRIKVDVLNEIQG